MIDFRYHLVSLISVFIALAIGIVLGAGPLGEGLGDQLTESVEQLRTEKEDLRVENLELTDDQMKLAQYVEDSAPQMLDGTLEGATVAVIAEHDSSREQVDAIETHVASAGAEVGLQVTMQEMIWDPAARQQRLDAVDRLREVAPVLVPEDQDPATVLTEAIAIVTTDDGTLDDAEREAVWQALVEGRVIVVRGETDAQIDAVTVVGAAPEDLQVATEDTDAADQRAQSLLTVRTVLLTSLAESEVPTVVSAATPGNDPSGGVLDAVRGDAAFPDLSSTDRLQQPDGPVISVLALAERMRGGVGDYGTAGTTDGQVPTFDRDVPLAEGTTSDSEVSDSSPSDGGAS